MSQAQDRYWSAITEKSYGKNFLVLEGSGLNGHSAKQYITWYYPSVQTVFIAQRWREEDMMVIRPADFLTSVILFVTCTFKESLPSV